jgi:adenine-specific DNA-methyltransferase
MPSLHWIGKQAVVDHLAQLAAQGLEALPALSFGTPASGNVIVEGDNLLALKALLPTHAGRIKCIYIDPPYNTGAAGWIFDDNVNTPVMRRWLDEVVGAEGETLDRHDRWLCMMYPRLVLLRDLLSTDGVIFVSIDDTEVHHLRALMDEVFGERAHLATLVWRTGGNFDNQAKIKHCHEYVLVYAPHPELFAMPRVVDPSIGKSSKLRRPVIRNTIVKNGPKNPLSEIHLPAGFPADVAHAQIAARRDVWPHYLDDARIIDHKLVQPVRVVSGWSSKSILQAFIAADFAPVTDSKGQATRFVITASGAIESIKERGQASHVISVLSGLGSTQAQSSVLAALGLKFSFPKPLALVKYLISLIDDRDFIVLDSFAGSGTSAEAVLELNASDGGTRRFVLVEMARDIARDVTVPRVQHALNSTCRSQLESAHHLKGYDYYQLAGSSN